MRHDEVSDGKHDDSEVQQVPPVHDISLHSWILVPNEPKRDDFQNSFNKEDDCEDDVYDRQGFRKSCVRVV